MVGQCGGFFSYSLPSVTRMGGICLADCFRRWSSFVDLFGDLHYLKHTADLLAGVAFKTPSLNIVLFSPSTGDGVE